MLLEPTAVESVILATQALHNMLMTSSAKNIFCPTGLYDTEDINSELTLGLCVLSRKADKASQHIYRSQRNSRYLG